MTFADKFKINKTTKYIGIILSFLLITIFFICPLIILFFFLNLEDFEFIFNDPQFYSALINSVFYCFISSICTILLAFFFAYIINRSSIKYKKLFENFMIIPMLIPSISIGLGLKMFFGDNGILNLLFPFINIEADGYLGLILGSINMTFPISFLLIYDCLKYEDKTVYDACETLNIKKLTAFKKITIPYIFKTLVIAFFVTFTFSVTDYGISFELRGKVYTLAFYLYEQVLSNFQYGRGVIISFILILPSITSFLVDYFLKSNQNQEHKDSLIKWDKKYNPIIYIILILFIFILVTPQISFITTSFIKSFPSNFAFTFDNYVTAFHSNSTISIGKGLLNSILLAIATSVLGTIFSFVLAYLTTRTHIKGKNILHVLVLCSQALPGLVLGIAYVCMFKGTSGYFYSTILILIVVNIFHFYSSPYIMCKNALSKMDMNYELYGDTLSINKFKIIFSVIIPNCARTLIQMFSYFFINCMVTISAISFLSTFFNQPLSLLILTYGRTDSYELQSVVASILFLFNVFAKFLFIYVEKLVEIKQNVKQPKLITYKKFKILTSLIKSSLTKEQLYIITNIDKDSLYADLKNLIKLGFIEINQNAYKITQKGISSISSYKVKNAVILAAGFGRRMIPLTFSTPKPLIKINGIPIIESQIVALHNSGITDITIVIGYKYKDFLYLKDKFKGINFVLNKDFINTNDIYSLSLVPDAKLNRTYILEGDIFIKNNSIFETYKYNSCVYVKEKIEDDPSIYTLDIQKDTEKITKYSLNSPNKFEVVGINYFNFKNSMMLSKDIKNAVTDKRNLQLFYDQYIFNTKFKYYKKTFAYQIELDSTLKVNTLLDLVKYDNSYEPILKEVIDDFGKAI